VWIKIFERFEEDHILIEFFDGGDDHFRFFYIEIFQEIYISGITVHARNSFFLEHGNDSWMLVDDQDFCVFLDKRAVEITSEFSITKKHDFIFFVGMFFVGSVPIAGNISGTCFTSSVNLLSVDRIITRTRYGNKSHERDDGGDVWIFDCSRRQAHGHEQKREFTNLRK